MSSSNYEIIVDKDKLLELNNTIEFEATSIENDLYDLEQIVKEIPDVFQGKISTTYVNSFTNYINKLDIIYEFNNEISEIVKQIVNQYNEHDVAHLDSDLFWME